MATITLVQGTFDVLLGLGLLWLAWRMLVCPYLFRAIILFISFGLLLALVWVRLDAPDVALAEAAIGTGLTGALLLAALAKIPVSEKDETKRLEVDLHRHLRWLSATVLVAVAAGLGYVVLSLPPDAAGLSAQVAVNLHQSGVSNPVTAVLLNFRGYDTLLEMVVLLLALLGVWSLEERPAHSKAAPGPVLDTLTRILVPFLILVAAYLLWVGAHAPGGAFQAGSVLGAAGVLLLLSGWQLPSRLAGLPLRLALIAGVGVFMIIAVYALLREGQLLQYPPAQAGFLILVVEIAATASIGISLTALFLGSRPSSTQDRL